MKLYLLRHAPAVSRDALQYPNDDRPLSAQGAKVFAQVAKGIAQAVPVPDLIVTSPMARARATARLLSHAYGRSVTVRVSRSLLPDAAPEGLIAELSRSKGVERVILIGHSPLLDDLAATLLGVVPGIVRLKKGGLCRIDIATTTAPATAAPVRGTLTWLAPPKLFLH